MNGFQIMRTLFGPTRHRAIDRSGFRKRAPNSKAWPVAAVAVAGISLVLVSGFPGLTAQDSSSEGAWVNGAFSVNRTGAATYELPIQVAPGNQGNHPALKLVYNSQNTAAGTAGVGWSLAGLSSIHRCGKQIRLDGVRSGVKLTDEDRLCRDGERMVGLGKPWPSSDSDYWNDTYATEVENWSRIEPAMGRCGAGPCGFIAREKNGTQVTYGGSSDARAFDVDGTISAWLMSEIRDRNGNAFTVNYTLNATGIPVPSIIEYNGRSVRFLYSTLNDRRARQFSYRFGRKYVADQELSQIHIATAEGIFKKYWLKYRTSKNSGRTLLTRIDECDGTGRCLEPVTFSYADPDMFNHKPEMFRIVTPAGPEYQDWLRADPGAKIIPGDFNGDGKMDFIRQEKAGRDNDDTNTFNVYLSRGDGYFDIVTPSGREYQILLKSDAGANIIPGDFNGDGKTDFIRQEKGDWDNDTTNTFNVYFSRGDGYFDIVAPAGRKYQDWLRSDPGANIIPGDFNGDGKTDFVRQERGGRDNDNTNTFNVYFSRGDGYFDIVTPSGSEYQKDLKWDAGAKIIPGDFNGDGSTDFIRQEHGKWDDDESNTFNVYFSRGDGYFDIVTPAGEDYQKYLKSDRGANIIPGDFNGDGKLDFIRQEHGKWDNDLSRSFQVYFSKGDGHFDIVTPSDSMYQTMLRADPGAYIIPGDFNGDGKTDFIAQHQNIWGEHTAFNFFIYFSKGNGYFDIFGPRAPEFVARLGKTLGANIIPGDFNGDGVTDWLRQEHGKWDDDTAHNFDVYFAGDPADPQPRDIMTGFTQGQVSHSLEYDFLSRTRMMTEPRLHWNTRSASFALPLVVAHTKSAQNLDPMTATYAYGGAISEIGGRGFLGFEYMFVHTSHDRRTTLSEFQLRFPHNGAETSRSIWANTDGPHPFGKLQRMETRELQAIQGLSARSFASVATTKTTRDYSHGSSPIQGAVSTTYNHHGNPVLVQTTNGSGSTSSCTDYAPDLENWNTDRVARVTLAEACSVSNQSCSCSGTIFEKNEFDYDPRGNAITHRMWDSSRGAYLTESMAYDTFGNRISHTDAGGTTETFEYDSTYSQFPVRVVTDASGKRLTRTYAYDPRFGEQTRFVDENGREIRTQYDPFGRLHTVAQSAPSGILSTTDTFEYGRNGQEYFVAVRKPDEWTGSEWHTSRSFADAYGRMVREELPGAGGKRIIKRTRYSAANQVIAESEPHFAGQTPRWNEYTYNDYGQRITVQHSNGTAATAEYDRGAPCVANESRVVSITKNRRVTTCYSAEGKKTATQFGSGAQAVTHRLVYDAKGRLIATNDDTTIEYDSLDRKTRVAHPEEGTKSYEYDSAGYLSRVVHVETGRTQSFEYDSLGRVIRAEFQDGSRYEMGYDDPAVSHSLGRLTRARVVSATGVTTSTREFAYEITGQTASVKLTVDGNDWILAYGYRPDGRRSTITYPGGRELQYAYDAAGNLSGVLAGETPLATFENYNAPGQPGRLVYANGVTTDMTYDPAFRLQQIRAANESNDVLFDHSFTWTGFNEIQRQEDSAGSSSIEYDYNDLGYLIRANGPSGNLEYRYDGRGNLVHKAGVDLAYSRDQVIASSAGGAWQYDGSGSVTRREYAGAVWDFEYDGAGRMSGVKKDGTQAGVYEYEASGQRVKKTDSQGIVSIYVAPELEITRFPSGKELRTEYVLGPSGRILAHSSLYDSLAANTHYQQHRMQAEMYSLSSLSGVAGFIQHSALMMVYHPDASRVPLFALIAFALGVFLTSVYAFVRSARRASWLGRRRAAIAWRLAELGALRPATARAWSQTGGPGFFRRHRLLSAPMPLLLVSMLTMSMQCGSHGGSDFLGVPAGVGEDPLAGMFVLNPGMNGAGYPEAGTFYFHQNQVGSTSFVTDADGNIVSRTIYKPYGEIDQEHSEGRDAFRHKFSDREMDGESGLYYMNARYYEPATGRFIQADSMVFGTDQPHATELNRYAYAANNPVMFNDPSGHSAVLGFLFVVGVSLVMGVAFGTAAYAFGLLTSGNRWDWKTFAISVGIGAGIGVIFALGGTVAFASLAPAGMSMQSGIVLGGVIGVTSGAASSAATSAAVQYALTGEVDWKTVGTDALWGAAFGVADGYSLGVAARNMRVRQNYVAEAKRLGTATTLTIGDGARSDDFAMQTAEAAFTMRKQLKEWLPISQAEVPSIGTVALKAVPRQVKNAGNYALRKLGFAADELTYGDLVAKYQARGFSGRQLHWEIARGSGRTSSFWTTYDSYQLGSTFFSGAMSRGAGAGGRTDTD